MFGWRWDECRRARVEAAASDPVLLLAKPPRVALEPSAGEKALVDREDVLDGDPWTVAERVNRPVHRLDVVEDLGRCDVLTGVLEPSRQICLEQATPTDLQAFDPR